MTRIKDCMPFSFSDERRRATAERLERGKRCQLLLEPEDPRYRAMDLVSRHQSTESEFCRACVRMGYLTAEQMARAAQRYRLGVNRYGAVIFWQIGLQGQVYDGKIMYYQADCHRDKRRNTTWVSAVIMSEIYRDYIWMAAGGLNELTPEKLFVLKGRRVAIFPDTDPEGQAFALWFGIARKAERLLGQHIFVSPLLEQRATADQKRRKIDILDFHFESK